MEKKSGSEVKKTEKSRAKATDSDDSDLDAVLKVVGMSAEEKEEIMGKLGDLQT